MEHSDHESVVAAALARLDLDAKARLLAGQDLWSLPALPEIGLGSLVMSDGPVGVRGTAFTAADPALALPSPTALAATWDPALARQAGHVLAQEARRKGVHLLLAPTVNLHRSPLAGRHFEAYSEDPLLTARIGSCYVSGVQEGGVGATVKHFVANDAETDRFTVDNQVTERTLHELYLAPFEEIIATARPWAVMSAYNQVNGVTMTEHRDLQTGVLREEWGFDGVVVSDWLAARDTVGAITGGLDIAMPGPLTVFGEALATAVRDGRVSEKDVDDAARRVLLLAARVGLLDGAEPTVPAHRYPPAVDGREVAREIAARSFVLLRNEGAALPLTTSPTGGGIALIGNAAREARILGGGSATVFPDRVISPLDGLRAALPHDTTLTYAVGANPNEGLTLAGDDFVLRCVLRDVHGNVLAEQPMPAGRVRWMASALPGGTDYDSLATVELVGTYTPRRSGAHHFGTQGMGAFRLSVDGTVIFDGVHRPEGADPLDALTGRPVARGTADLVAERPVKVSLLASAPKMSYGPLRGVTFGLAHRGPAGEEDQLIEEAVATAAAAEVAVVVVATTEAVESEGFDRTTLRLPGRQDELVSRVAAANPRTVVVVNSGSPVEMPWRDEVTAILLSWFPGQEGGAALADVLLGTEEPGGRLPTTWPAALADAPVTKVTPNEGVLAYDEGVFIGYRAWQRHTIAPAYPFGYGLGYTDWTYEDMTVTDGSVRVRLRNTGSRPGREVVQVYAAPAEPDPGRASRWLVGFATVAAEAGDSAEAQITLPERAFQTWDETTSQWVTVPGRYHLHAARCATRTVLSAEVDVTGS
ncbi:MULTISPECIES: beta-glucosidase family protein [unclassified Streptomyces]|uniref:beta-glucosidase family protein n=1 Tax=unclassified Streptomyces TaxID=2593676 RepID=UPI002966A30C|nr:glycoside hydrolase family 3 C-terminal domain-containing protein [Streptomyces sp. SJL17-1]